MDVKPISLCDYLLSYKQFLLVIHYILQRVQTGYASAVNLSAPMLTN